MARTQTPTAGKGLGLAYHPWAWFALFALSDAAIAYTAAPLVVKLWILLLGILIPGVAGLYLASPAPSSEKPVYARDLFPAPSLGWGMALGLAALALRFYGIPSFFTYPNMDEFTNAYYALHLAQQWDWHPFFHYSQLPPFYIWLLAVLYKAFGVSLSALWLLPAFLSLFVVALAYPTARLFFSRSFAWLCLGLTALSFWAFYLGRFSHQVNLMMVWEYGALALAGFYLKSPGPKRALALGLAVGLGFYTYFGWVLLAALFTAGMALHAFLRRPSRPSFAWYAGGLLAALLPLLPTLLSGGYGHYIGGLLITRPGFQGFEWEPSEVFYGFAVFSFGTWRKYFSYGPWWGGLLNPLLTGFFGVGILELARHSRKALPRWLAASFLVLFLPMLLASIFNALRLAALLPVFTVVAAVGLAVLWARLLPRWRWGVFLSLALLSVGLDLVNLEKTRDYVNRTYTAQKTVEKERAWHLLQKIQAQSGPGWVFDHWTSDFWDVSLDLVAYPFNALENPNLEPAIPAWGAVFLPASVRPQFLKRWPHAQWFNLDEGQGEGAHYFDLAVFPLSDLGPDLPRWKEAQSAILRADYLYRDAPKNLSRRGVTAYFRSCYPLFQEDPSLQTLFCMKYFYYCSEDPECPSLIQQALELQPLRKEAAAWLLRGLAEYEGDRGDFPQALAALDHAMEWAGPNGGWYFQRANLLVRAQRYGEAKKDFLRAGKLIPSLALPPEMLQNLDRLESSMDPTPAPRRPL